VGIISQPGNRSVEESDQPDGILSKRKSLRGRGLSKALPLLRVISKPERAEGAGSLRPYSNGFCRKCRGELRSPKRYIIKAQVPNGISNPLSVIEQISYLLFIKRLACIIHEPKNKEPEKLDVNPVFLGVK
jgi:hypothetical protein